MDGRSDVSARSVGNVGNDFGERLLFEQQDRLYGADFSSRSLTHFSSNGSSFEACRFDGIRIGDGSFGGGYAPSLYARCSFDGADIRFGAGGVARFVECSFRNVRLRDWFCFAVELVNCTFSGRIERSFFNSAVTIKELRDSIGRETNEFVGNDFRDAELVIVDFRTGIDLDKQHLPSGPGYLLLSAASVSIERARRYLAQTGHDVGDEATRVLDGLERDVRDGQDQLFLQATSIEMLGPELGSQLWSALTQAVEGH